MNPLLLYPTFTDTFRSFKHVLKLIRKRASLPPHGLLTVAAIPPSEWVPLTTGILLLLASLVPVASRAETITILFNYPNRGALLADGWSFHAITNQVTQNVVGASFSGGLQNTEITDPNIGAGVSYARTNGSLGIVTRIPCDMGYMYGSPVVWTNGNWPSLAPYPLANRTRNSLFRILPTNWVSMRLSASFDPAENYHQLELMLYQDDDNYLEEEFSHSTNLMGSPFNLAGPTGITLDREFYSFPSRASWTFFPGTNVTLRLDRDVSNDNISALWSEDGANWTLVGQISQGLTNAQVGIIVGGSPSTFPLSKLPYCDLSRLEIITSDTYSPPPPVLVLQPQQLVFNSVQNQPCVVTQSVNVVLRRTLNPAAWTVTSDSSWLQVGATSGLTPAACDVSVNTAGMTAGVYQDSLTFAATGTTNSPAEVNVTLILNPNGLVNVSTWKNAKAAAMSVWVDDSRPSGFDELSTNGVAGTYVMWHERAPSFYTTFYQAGMELGSHLVDHPCFLMNEPSLRFEIETNILGLVTGTPVPRSQVISLAWPCGNTSLDEEAVAAEYFLVSRGYNINQLEDPTPRDFMNLKSFNSHEHAPFPPADLKTVVDAAIAQGKWFNLVLHAFNNNDRAISYSVGKNIWVAPGGTVTKYILQRDRVVITDYIQTGNSVQFNCCRLPLDPSPVRSFETAITPNDLLTFTINTSRSPVSSLFVDGVPTSFATNGNVLFFNAQVTTNLQAVVLNFVSNTPSVLPPGNFVDASPPRSRTQRPD